jgi:hypothetical protein
MAKPYEVEEVHITRFAAGFGAGFRRIVNDVRILVIVVLIGIALIFGSGMLFMLNEDRGSTATLYIPLIFFACWLAQRLARRHP